MVVRREVGSPKTIEYSLSNAPSDTSRLRLAQMQRQRYWVERAFEDAKSECGLAGYQALGWRAWHHHVAIVMLAVLFIAQQRVARQPGLDLLTPRDIVEMLKETLPRKPEGKEALVARINQRIARRQGAIESRFRTRRKAASGCAKIMPENLTLSKQAVPGCSAPDPAAPSPGTSAASMPGSAISAANAP